MKEIKAPVVGDKILEEYKEKFLKKYSDESSQVTGIQFWPAIGIEETYRKAAEAIGGPNEAQVLKAFYEKMVSFLRMATYTSLDPGEDELILAALEGDI